MNKERRNFFLNKERRNFFLTADARRIIDGKVKELGISKSGVVELALRNLTNKRTGNTIENTET